MRYASMRGIIAMLCVVLAVLFMMPLSCSSRDSGTKVEILLGINIPRDGDGKRPSAMPFSQAMGRQIFKTLEQRLHSVGYKGFEVNWESGFNILVTVPFDSAPDKNEIVKLERLFTHRGVLEFREQKPDGISNALEWSTVMDGSLIDRESVTLRTNKDMGTQEIAFSFNEKGKKLFEEVTARNKGKKLGIFLDGNLLTAPIVMEAIKDGKSVITGAYNNTESECREWAACLRQPPLPVQLTVKKTEVKALQR